MRRCIIAVLFLLVVAMTLHSASSPHRLKPVGYTRVPPQKLENLVVPNLTVPALARQEAHPKRNWISTVRFTPGNFSISRHYTRQYRSASPVSPTVSPGGVWACIRFNESRNNYAEPGGGAYQFLVRTWHQVMAWMGLGTFDPRTGVYSGPYPIPEQSPPGIQDEAAVTLQQHSGWGQWTTHWLCGV